jgi:uncharacterized delta-60 repeat protein
MCGLFCEEVAVSEIKTLVPTIAITLFILSTLPAFGEMIVDTAWVRTYNGPGNDRDWARDMALDESGNVYVTGESYGDTTFHDYATVKYHPNGDTAWARRYSGPGNAGDRAYAVAVDRWGNVYVTGESFGDETGFDYATVKYYPDGETAWVARYNGPGNENDAARAIAVDDSGYVYVTGWSYGDGTHSDYATLKYCPDGDTAWVRRYHGPGNGGDWACAIEVDDSANVYVTGQSYGGLTVYNDYVTIKYNPNGDTAWLRRYNGPGSYQDLPYAMAVDALGCVYVTGESIGSGIEPDYLTIKYDPDGDTAWTARWDGPVQWWDGAYAVAVDSLGNVCVTGGSFWSLVEADYTTIRYYRNGDTAWVRRYGGSPEGGDCAYDIAVDAEGNVYVTGLSSSGADLDCATIKYYPSGDTAWLRRYNGPENGDDGASALALDGFGSVYVVGHSHAGTAAEDYLTIKYFQALRGDANGDGAIDPADIVYLINYLFRSGTPPDPVQVGDTNSDGITDPADVVYLINYLFRNGPPP